MSNSRELQVREKQIGELVAQLEKAELEVAALSGELEAARKSLGIARAVTSTAQNVYEDQIRDDEHLGLICRAIHAENKVRRVREAVALAHDRYHHLDGIIRESGTNGDPLHRTAAELWILVEAMHGAL